MQIKPLQTKSHGQLQKQITNALVGKDDGTPPHPLKIIIPLCVGFSECPDTEEYAGLIYALEKLGFTNYATYLVPASQQAEEQWRKDNAEIVKLIENKPENVEAYREQDAWQQAYKKYNDFLTSTWGDYKQRLISEGRWDATKPNFYAKYQAAFNKVAGSDDQLSELFQQAQQDLRDALANNLNNFHSKHQDIERGVIEKHLVKESIDCLALMEPLVGGDPSAKSVILYKKSLTLYANKVKQYAWLMGYDSKSLDHQKIIFDSQPVSIVSLVVPRPVNDSHNVAFSELDHANIQEMKAREMERMAMAFGIMLAAQKPDVIPQVMLPIFEQLAEQRISQTVSQRRGNQDSMGYADASVPAVSAARGVTGLRSFSIFPAAPASVSRIPEASVTVSSTVNDAEVKKMPISAHA